MNRTVITTCALFLLIFCVGASAQVEITTLTARQVERAIPVFRVEVAGIQATHARSARGEGMELVSVVEAASSGRIEPLEWLKTHSKYALVPPSAIYDVACSRDITRQEGFPTAAFGFGLTAPSSDTGAAPKGKASSFPRVPVTDAKTSAMIKSIREFYEANGVPYKGQAQFFHSFNVPDGSVSIVMFEQRPYGYGPCANMPSGLILEISLSIDKHNSPQGPDAGEAALQAALKKAGLEDSEYRGIIMSLDEVRPYVANRSTLDEEERAAKAAANSPEEAQFAAVMIKAAETRRKNREVYMQRRAELDPLFTSRDKILFGK